MQAGQNFMRLAAALADAFTVYLPDRRGGGSAAHPATTTSWLANAMTWDLF
jgi:hypothetical protein